MAKGTTKVIALFNHKGGVSKTTTTFNLGWMLASRRHTVIIVDGDPQCNLTGMVLDYRGARELEKFYETESERNIMAGLAPAFESRPKAIEGINCIAVSGREGLYLLPGHLRLAEYEVTLGIAQELSAAIQTLKNLPGALPFLLRKTADKMGADYVIIDMSPSLSSINQNLLMTSDFFIVPTSPDYFSVMAIESLATVLPRWHDWAEKASSLPVLRDADYPFPEPNLKFLGTIIQKYRPRGGGVPAVAFQTWINEINERVAARLIPVLTKSNMVLHEKTYQGANLPKELCLATISDFNSLIAKSQESRTPIFALSKEQIGQTGIVLERTVKSQQEFLQVFSHLADEVTLLTTSE
jgi:cellulose biosynthesis protein BcsQ